MYKASVATHIIDIEMTGHYTFPVGENTSSPKSIQSNHPNTVYKIQATEYSMNQMIHTYTKI